MNSLLKTLKDAYYAYFDEFGIAPDYLLLQPELYSQLTLELAAEEKIHRPYIDDVTILELNTASGWLYIKK
jgi:hypothetical protein